MDNTDHTNEEAALFYERFFLENEDLFEETRYVRGEDDDEALTFF